MSPKVGFLFVTLLIGSYAHPVKENDMSIFFDHTDSSARVIGGTEAGLVPYMVAITLGVFNIKSFMCGGSLISTKHVLTAAHCIDFFFQNGQLHHSLRITVGTSRWETGGSMYKLAGNVTHADWDRDITKNDIGVLITEGDVALSSTVSLVSLNFDYMDTGVPTVATGWGFTRFQSGTMSEELLQLSANVVDGDYCVTEVPRRAQEIRWHVPPVDPSIEICALTSEGRGMCNGDSGSPLMRADINQQIGIVSWGLPCARGAPDMFVRLSVYESWIKQIVN